MAFMLACEHDGGITEEEKITAFSPQKRGKERPPFFWAWHFWAFKNGKSLAFVSKKKMQIQEKNKIRAKASATPRTITWTYLGPRCLRRWCDFLFSPSGNARVWKYRGREGLLFPIFLCCWWMTMMAPTHRTHKKNRWWEFGDMGCFLGGWVSGAETA